jgi:hypothetical protein
MSMDRFRLPVACLFLAWAVPAFGQTADNSASRVALSRATATIHEGVSVRSGKAYDMRDVPINAGAKQRSVNVEDSAGGTSSPVQQQVFVIDLP